MMIIASPEIADAQNCQVCGENGNCQTVPAGGYSECLSQIPECAPEEPCCEIPLEAYFCNGGSFGFNEYIGQSPSARLGVVVAWGGALALGDRLPIILPRRHGLLSVYAAFLQRPCIRLSSEPRTAAARDQASGNNTPKREQVLVLRH
jgi:hypothetical protein